MRHLYTIFFLLLLSVTNVQAEEIIFRLKEFNKSTGDFDFSIFGQRPAGSVYYFENEFGATSGNRYNQIPRNRHASLMLAGWEGCTIRKVTLWMCSNNKAGQFGIDVTSGETSLCSIRPKDFNEWTGSWVSKDLSTYVTVSQAMQHLSPIGKDEMATITIKGGTQEGSVYLDAISIDYEPGDQTKIESAMGYRTTKLEKKSVLQDGDRVMIYRSGSAAGDIDGMETAQYLDAIGIASTSNVYENAVEYFTLGKQDGGWTLTDQYGRQLGAGSSKLLWDAGERLWSITLGYDGATLADASGKYGTMRYNQPDASWARFNMYTSKSLPLPYLYRIEGTVEPVQSQRIDLPFAERTVDLAQQDTIVVRASLYPATTTDFRLTWISSNESVATVNNGVVFLHAMGSTLITARAINGGCESAFLLHVSDATDGIDVVHTDSKSHTPSNVVYDSSGRCIDSSNMKTSMRSGIYIIDGKKILK